MARVNFEDPEELLELLRDPKPASLLEAAERPTPDPGISVALPAFFYSEWYDKFQVPYPPWDYIIARNTQEWVALRVMAAAHRALGERNSPALAALHAQWAQRAGSSRYNLFLHLTLVRNSGISGVNNLSSESRKCWRKIASSENVVSRLSAVALVRYWAEDAQEIRDVSLDALGEYNSEFHRYALHALDNETVFDKEVAMKLEQLVADPAFPANDGTASFWAGLGRRDIHIMARELLEKWEKGLLRRAR